MLASTAGMNLISQISIQFVINGRDEILLLVLTYTRYPVAILPKDQPAASPASSEPPFACQRTQYNHVLWILGLRRWLLGL